ncbi:TRAP transporter small permease [Microbaculum marinum]|uniref:TRAP transporter small permease protein n=1 Tax=Microbaculum marinum TaxID=1764581 RepID=A0AAW9RB11_9HYPH
MSEPGATASDTAGRSRALRLAEFVLGVMVAVLLIAMMLVTAVDVFGRYLLSRPLPGAFEITEIMLALIIFIALPLVCLHEEHVSVTLITDRLRPRWRQIHSVVVSIFSAAVLLLIAWRITAHSLQLASYGEVTIFLRFPKGPIGYTIAAFTVLAALATMIVAWHHLNRFRRTDA